MTRWHAIRGRVRRQGSHAAGRREEEVFFVDVAPDELAGVFAAPRWLRDFGALAWLLVGISALLVAAVALLALINTIVIPVVTATIIAAVCSPLVRRLARHMPRALATVVVFLSLVAAGAGVAVLVIAGIASQASTMQDSLQKAVDKLESALQDAGASADKAQQASSDASSSVSGAFHALLEGLGTGISALASLAVFLSFTALSLFFLLKDGPTLRDWTERHMGLPHTVARVITGRTLGALRGYFAGVTAPHAASSGWRSRPRPPTPRMRWRSPSPTAGADRARRPWCRSPAARPRRSGHGLTPPPDPPPASARRVAASRADDAGYPVAQMFVLRERTGSEPDDARIGSPAVTGGRR